MCFPERSLFMSEQKKETKPVDSYDYLKASSAQDCTGLIPSGIQTEEELKHYEELYPFLPKASSKPKHL